MNASYSFIIFGNSLVPRDALNKILFAEHFVAQLFQVILFVVVNRDKSNTIVGEQIAR